MIDSVVKPELTTGQGQGSLNTQEDCLKKLVSK